MSDSSAAAPTPTPAPTPAPESVSRWEETIRQFEQIDAAGATPANPILFAGSSSFTLWKLADYFPDRPDLVNRGFGGSKLSECAELATRYVTPPRPRQVVVYAGDNDLGMGGSPADVLAAYRLFVANVRSKLPEAPILFVSIKPSPSRAHLLGAMRETNRLVLDETRRGAAGLGFLDVFTPMLNADGQPRPELFVEDNLHMNHAGYVLWAGLLRPLLLPQA